METAALAPWRERNPLREWRRVKGLTVADAAIMLRVSGNTLVKWERGGGTPSQERMARIAAVTRNRRIAQEWDTWKQQSA